MKKINILFVLFCLVLTQWGYGRILKDDFILNSEKSGGAVQENPVIIYNSSNERIGVWESGHSADQDIWMYFLDSDNKTGMLINDDTGFHNQYQPSMQINSGDRLIVVWVDERNGNPDIYGQIIGSDMQKIGSNFKISSDVSTAIQQNPAVSINDSGAFVVVWEDFRDDSLQIYGQKYNIDGVAVWSNFKLAQNGSATHAMLPDVIQLESDSFIVAWHDNRNGDDDIFLEWFDSYGNASGSVIQINQDTTKTHQCHPALLLSESGRLFIGWQDARNGDTDIYFQEMDLEKNFIGSNSKANDDGSGNNQCCPQLSFRDDKLLVLAWQDERNGNSDVHAQAFSSTLTRLGSNILLNDDINLAEQSMPDLSMDEDGNFCIVWSDDRNDNPDIFGQTYSEQGIRIGENVKLNPDTLSSSQVNPDIAMNESGIILCVWESDHNGYNDIYAQFLDADGNPAGENFLVNTNTGSRHQKTPACAINEAGESVIVWRYDGSGKMEIKGQRFDSNMQAEGDNFTINPVPGDISENHPDVAIAKDGGFAVVWRDAETSDFNIYLRKYDSDGLPVTDPLLVNDDGTGADQRHPVIGMDRSGNSVVAWEDNRTGQYDIYGQFCNQAGNPVGLNVRLTDDSLSVYHGSPSVDVDTSGLGVVVWRDNRNGNPDIFAQCFTISGEFNGSNFMAIEDSSGLRQEYPDVAIESKGRFLIACHETGLSGNIYMLVRRFDSQNKPIASSLQWIADSVSSKTLYPSVAANGQKMSFAWQDTRNLQGWDIACLIMDWEWEIETSVKSQEVRMTSSQLMVQNYPNPFNGQTWIEFDINRPGKMSIVIYNIKGQKIKDLSQSIQESGHHHILWNGTDTQNRMVSSGIYFVQIQNEDFTKTHRMLFLK